MTTMAWTYDDHWVNLLGQDEVWQDAHGTRHRLDDMDTGYCARVAAFILRQTDSIVDLMCAELVAARESRSEQGQWAQEQAENAFLEATSEDATAWLKEQPLLVALKHRAEGLPARPSTCHCGYPYQSGDGLWDHSACYPGIIVD